MKRLEAVACDAELQEKPLAELRKLGELLHERCIAYMNEQTKENNETNNVDEGGKNVRKRIRGPSFKLGGVSVNAKTMMACEEELQPLDEVLPSNQEERNKWVLDARVKPAHFDVEWDVNEDSKLLQGIYTYGMGAWEQIKLDPTFGICDKILLNEDKKPQAKHLQSRAEYLLKILRKQLDMKKGVSKPKKPRKVKENDKKKDNKPALTKEIVEVDESSNEDSNAQNNTNSNSTSPKKSAKNSSNKRDIDDDSSNIKFSGTEKKERKKDKKKDKKSTGPMHFTAMNEPRALEVLGDLDPAIFNECKEK